MQLYQGDGACRSADHEEAPLHACICFYKFWIKAKLTCKLASHDARQPIAPKYAADMYTWLSHMLPVAQNGNKAATRILQQLKFTAPVGPKEAGVNNNKLDNCI